MSEATVKVRRGFVKPLYGGHPWIFADAVGGVEGSPESGAIVRAVDSEGKFLGRGFYNSKSAIAVRLLTRLDEKVDVAFLRDRIEAAANVRRVVLGLGAPGSDTTAFRWINSDGDGLSGLIVDRYGETLSVQFQSAGFERLRKETLELLQEVLAPARIVDRSENTAREKEGLPPAAAMTLAGEELKGPQETTEAGAVFEVVFSAGQKTGLYLDQRENRARVRQLAAGRRVLDVYCYTCAFGIQAKLGGAAELTLIEKSPKAAEQGLRNLTRNGMESADLIRGDAIEVMKGLHGEGKRYDLIVLDPPKFARGKEGVAKAMTQYREVNLDAMRLLADGPGAILVTCSCSGSVSEQEFERTVGSAAVAAGRSVTLVERRGAAADHPGLPGLDQGRYLKCLILATMR